MKLALLLNAIDPGIGGVLIRGQKGTAKSTAVRGLAAMLPRQEVVGGCACGCAPGSSTGLCPECRERAVREPLPINNRTTPVVDLPLNATEDMIIGGFDFEQALQSGNRRFQAGLLARAHRGFLYIDEANLLVDHLADVIMDAAGSGINVVEREGVSHWHPSRFALVGTMNPEEGEIRPQLLDRFGLCVAVEGEQDAKARVLLLERRELFDADPSAFTQSFAGQSQMMAQAIITARELLPGVALGKHILGFIGNLCLENNVAGHRADIILRLAARAMAAYQGRTIVSEEDVARVAPMVFFHRRREAHEPPPPPQAQQPEQEPQDDTEPEQQQEQRGQQPDNGQQNAPQDQPEQDTPPPEGPDGPGQGEMVFEIGATFKVRHLQAPKDRKLRIGSGRRSVSRTAMRRGRYSRSVEYGSGNDLALDATLRAAAANQAHRQQLPGMALAIERSDWRYKQREARIGNFLLFVVDASGSMGAQSRMVAAKGAVMSLLLDAYQKRDKVAMVSFRGDGAETLLPPTSSVELSARLLAEMPVGGRTPLSAGLATAHDELLRQLRREPDCRPIALLITDGKANAGQGQASPLQEALNSAAQAAKDDRVRWVVVDTEAKQGFALGLAAQLATALNAEYFQTEQLKAQDLLDLARS